MANLYTGAMGMISFQNKLEVVGNNIANARTNGYKKDVETFKVFEESYMKILSNDRTETIGSYQHQVHTDQVHTNMMQGSLVQTGGGYDFALRDQEEGTTNFFVVEQNGQEMLTRDGAFQRDVDGYLSMNDGSFVLDTEGERIQLAEGVKLAIDRNGELVDQNTGESVAQLGVKQVEEGALGLLEKSGNNKFTVMTEEAFVGNFGPLEGLMEAYDNNISLRRLFPDRELVQQIVDTGQINVAEDGETYDIMVGVLEQSNVDTATEMTEMMIAQRGFQANAKMLQVMDKINEKDANQII